jgi:16S rRNA U1498 N3-methylase RsmE
MQIDRKVVEQALEALEFMADEWGFTQKANRPERWKAISALQAALAQPEDKSQAAFEHWVETVEATAEATCKQSLQVEPIIEPEINVNTWHGLTDAERDYFKACGFVGVSRVEEVLRAKNSTLACIPAVPPG